MAFTSIVCASGSVARRGNVHASPDKRSITRSTIVSRKGMRLLPVEMLSHPLTMKQALEADHHFRI